MSGRQRPGTGVEADAFFKGFSELVHDMAPRNRELLAVREGLQDKIDDWHRDNGAPTDLETYKAFLREIGYLQPEGESFARRFPRAANLLRAGSTATANTSAPPARRSPCRAGH